MKVSGFILCIRMVGSKFSQLPSLTFYADSSSRDDLYMVVGGFAVDGQYIEKIESKITKLREKAGIQSEFHWSEYKGGGRKKAYFALVDYGFNLVRNKYAAFHVMIVPFKNEDHRSGYDRKKNASATAAKDETINKMYRELLLHKVAKQYGNERSIQVKLDAGSDSSDVIKRSGYISMKAYQRFQVRPGCVRSIEAIDSKEAGLIQMADVIIGGIAASRNKRKINPVKSALRDHIMQSSGRDDWHTSTNKDEEFLSVWNFTKQIKR